MNGLPDRPATPPLPPPPGAFGRVRRRAFLRKMRFPAAGAVAAAFLAGAVSVAPSPQATDRLRVADSPTTAPATVASTAEPTPYETAGTDVTAPPSPSAEPQPSSTGTVSPASLDGDEDIQPGGFDEIWPTEPPGRVQTRKCSDLDHTPHPSDVTGVVVDRRGKPVPGIAITTVACVDDVWWDGATATTTDAQGRFRFACFEDHWAIASPFHWWHGGRTSSADVGFRWFDGVYGAVPCGSDHRIVLPGAATVNVQLVDPAHKPVAAVKQVPLFMSEDEATNFVAVTTDETGRGSFTGLAPGSYVVWTDAGHPTRFTVAEGETADVRVWTESAATPSPSQTATPTVTPSAEPEPSSTP